jgi:hypothetical protein
MATDSRGSRGSIGRTRASAAPRAFFLHFVLLFQFGDYAKIFEGGRTVGTFFSNGIRPKFSERLKSMGFELPADMFEQTKERWK